MFYLWLYLKKNDTSSNITLIIVLVIYIHITTPYERQPDLVEEYTPKNLIAQGYMIMRNVIPPPSHSRYPQIYNGNPRRLLSKQRIHRPIYHSHRESRYPMAQSELLQISDKQQQQLLRRWSIPPGLEQFYHN